MDFKICSQQIYRLQFHFLHINKKWTHKKFTGNIVTTDNNYCVRTDVWGASYCIVEAETEDFTAPASKTHKNSLSAQNDYLFIIHHWGD